MNAIVEQLQTYLDSTAVDSRTNMEYDIGEAIKEINRLEAELEKFQPQDEVEVLLDGDGLHYKFCKIIRKIDDIHFLMSYEGREFIAMRGIGRWLETDKK